MKYLTSNAEVNLRIDLVTNAPSAASFCVVSPSHIPGLHCGFPSKSVLRDETIDSSIAISLPEVKEKLTPITRDGGPRNLYVRKKDLLKADGSYDYTPCENTKPKKSFVKPLAPQLQIA